MAETFTIQEIGNRIKQRNPEQLKAFSDEEIGQRAVDRNPELQTLVTPTEQPAAAPDESELLGFAKGIGKGALSTLRGAAELGERGITGLLRTLLPKAAERRLGIEEGVVTPQVDILQQQAEQRLGVTPGALTTPTTQAQKVGFGAEQISEFFAPGAAPFRAGRAAKAAVSGTKAVKSAARLGAIAGTEAGLAAGQTALQKGEVDKEVGQAALLGAVFPVAAGAVGTVLRPVGKTAGTFGAELFGKFTGVKTEALQQAFKNPNVIRFAREAGKDMTVIQDEVLDFAQKGLGKLRENRAFQYQERLGKVKTSNQKLGNIVDDTRARMTQLEGDLGPIVEGRNIVDKALEDVKTWTDNTPVGLDNLKRRLNSFADQLRAADKAPARRIVTELRNVVREGLEKEVSGYKQMTRGYAEASELIDEIKKTLSLGDSRKRETALNKLLQSTRPGKERRLVLLKELQKVTSEDIIGRIAGSQLAEKMPRGLLGALTPTTGLVAGLLKPSVLPEIFLVLALTSPRLVGELVSILGAVSRSQIKSDAFSPQVQRAIRELIVKSQQIELE